MVACFGGMIRWYADFGGMPGVDACAGGMRAEPRDSDAFLFAVVCV